MFILHNQTEEVLHGFSVFRCLGVSQTLQEGVALNFPSHPKARVCTNFVLNILFYFFSKAKALIDEIRNEGKVPDRLVSSI